MPSNIDLHPETNRAELTPWKEIRCGGEEGEDDKDDQLYCSCGYRVQTYIIPSNYPKYFPNTGQKFPTPFGTFRWECWYCKEARWSVSTDCYPRSKDGARWVRSNSSKHRHVYCGLCYEKYVNKAG
jgi:hypothetical protein